MCKVEDVKSIIQNAAKLVKFLKISGLNSHPIMKGSSVKSFCKTRWNTVHDVLKSIVLNYTKIINVLQAKEAADKSKKTKVLNKILCLPRDEMENIIEFLNFFEKATNEMKANRYCIEHGR